jgi:hypothetical protein
MDPTLVPTLTPTPATVILAQPIVAVTDHTTQILAFLSPIILAVLAYLVKRLETVHQLVNSRMTAALAKIATLEGVLYKFTGTMPTGEPEQPAAGTARRASDTILGWVRSNWLVVVSAVISGLLILFLTGHLK